MPDEIIPQLRGRVSEPSHTVAPSGSLLRADNCVLRRPGVLSPAPDPQDIVPAVQTFQAVSMSDQYDNGPVSAQLVIGDTGAPAATFRARSTQAPGVNIPYRGIDGALDQHPELYRHSGGAVTFDYTTYPFHGTRGNVYTCDKRSVYKWTSADGTELVPVRDAASRVTWAIVGGGGFLPVGSHVGYVVVIVYADGNGVIRRSAPSPTAVAFNNGVDGTPVSVFLDIPEFVRVDPTLSHVEIYRTRTFADTVRLPNEFYLVADLTWLQYGFLSGPYVDNFDDADLGAALYTSSSQGGGLAVNYTPPEHLYHATFRGYEFWGNVAEKELFPALLHTGTSADLFIAFTGDVTSGVALIEDVSTAGLEVGMWVQSAGAFPDGTYITSVTDIGGGLFDIGTSEVSTLTTPGASITAYPGILVKTPTGETFRGYMNGTFRRIELIDNVPFPNQGLDVVLMAGVGRTVPSPYDFDATLSHVLRTARSGPSQMWINNPEDFEGTEWADLGATNGDPAYGTGTDALPALHRRRIYWSKLEEPEHTTLDSFLDVDTDEQIVGLGALTDALLILTVRGVYRLTGSGGNWRVDPLDASRSLVGGRTSQVMNNALYTLGDRGLVRITSTGVEDLSDGVVGDWFEERPVLDEGAITTRMGHVRSYLLLYDGYHPLFLIGASNTARREYTLFCESFLDLGSVSETQTYALVFNAKTGAFTTFTPAAQVVFCTAYARGYYLDRSQPQDPGITYGYLNLQTGENHIALRDNTPGRLGALDQDIATRALTAGDSTHLKIWTAVVWDSDGEATLEKFAVFQASERQPALSEEIVPVDGEEMRAWLPREAVRCTKLVAGIRGQAVTLYGARLTFASSGRESPITAAVTP